ncbi:MAG: ABC transporter permease [Cellulosilyticaceae bacterium]
MKDNRVIYRIGIGIALACVIIPLLLMIIWAVTKRWEWPYLLPSSYGLRAINQILDPYNQVFKVLMNSIILSGVVTLITLAITLPAAKALTFYPIRFKKVWYLLIWAPLIVPSTSIGMGIHRQMIEWGLANTWVGVVIVQLVPTIPYGMLMIQDVYELMGEKLEIQAKMLGASTWQTLVLVTIPMLRPAIVVAAVFVFTVSFGQYFLTFLIGGGNVMTLPMLMFPFVQQGDRMLSAVYSILFVGTLLITLHLFERIMKRHF